MLLWCKEEQMMVKCLYELSLEHFLIHNLDCPTHKDGYIIDLIFTNNSDLIHNLTVIPAPNSDHYFINWSAVYSRATEPKEDEPEDNENMNEFSFHHLNFFNDTVNWDSLLATAIGQESFVAWIQLVWRLGSHLCVFKLSKNGSLSERLPLMPTTTIPRSPGTDVLWWEGEHGSRNVISLPRLKSTLKHSYRN